MHKTRLIKIGCIRLRSVIWQDRLGAVPEAGLDISAAEYQAYREFYEALQGLTGNIYFLEEGVLYTGVRVTLH